MPRTESIDYAIDRSAVSEGKLWVNGPVNCLGRFHNNGFEIFRDLNGTSTSNLNGRENTLAVRKREKKAPTDWQNFVELMRQHHSIDLSEEQEPNADA